MRYHKFCKVALCCMLTIVSIGFNIGRDCIYASEERNFEEDVKKGALYSNEEGKIIDKDGNIIPEYDYIEVLSNGTLVCFGDAMANYSVGAGGKIAFTIPESVEYSNENEVNSMNLGLEDDWREILPQSSSAFIFSESDSRRISNSELQGLKKSTLIMAINEIYARRGMRFSNPQVQDYFHSKEWYIPIIDEEDFTDDRLNENETCNIAILKDCIDEYVESDEEKMNGYYDLEYLLNSGRDLTSYLGCMVYFQGKLIANNVDTFVLDGIGNVSYIEANYDKEKIKNAPSNETIQEHPTGATVWGTLSELGDETGIRINMESIYIGNSNRLDVREVSSAYFGDWPEEIGEVVKCTGTYMAEDGGQKLKLGRDTLDITFDINSFNNLPIYGYCTLDTFNNRKVAVYGSMAGGGIMCINYIEPLSTENGICVLDY